MKTCPRCGQELRPGESPPLCLGGAYPCDTSTTVVELDVVSRDMRSQDELVALLRGLGRAAPRDPREVARVLRCGPRRAERALAALPRPTTTGRRAA